MIRRLAVAALLVIAAAVSGVAAAGSAAGSAPPLPQRRPLIAAHRGGSAVAPENSLAAFRAALALGVDALEFDVHQTADGEAVVIHDPTLDRTTTLRGPVRDVRRATLGTARLKGRDGAPTEERVPTLAEVLDLAARAKVEILPEIKSDATGAPYDGLEAKVLDALRKRTLVPRAVIQSFDARTLARVRAQAATARTMLLASRLRLGAEGLGPMDVVRRAVDVAATDVGLFHRLLDDGVVSAAHAAGLRVAAWTVNEEADLYRMRELDVDVVITDRPDVAKRIYGR